MLQKREFKIDKDMDLREFLKFLFSDYLENRDGEETILGWTDEGGNISLDEMLSIWIKFSQKNREQLMSFEQDVVERIVRHIHALAPKVFYNGDELEELVRNVGKKIINLEQNSKIILR